MRFFLLITILFCIGCGCPRVKPQPLPSGPFPPEMALSMQWQAPFCSLVG